MTTIVNEFRGTDMLYYAEVLSDDENGYVTGEVKRLAPVAEISKEVDTSSETHYYDNKAAIVIDAEGSDTVTLTISALTLDTLADISGKGIDEETGAYLDGEAMPKYFALGYRLKLIGDKGGYRYVWRFKGKFNVPNETSATENDGTDTNNQELTYTGIMTNAVFAKTGKPMRAIVVDEADGKADVSTWFDEVTTIDTLKGVSGTTTNPSAGGGSSSSDDD